MADYYEILGVPRNCSSADVRKAYALKAREQHPDRFSDPAQKKEAEVLFTEITAAFNALSNDRSRAEYDSALQRPSQATPEAIAQNAYARGMERLENRAFHEAVELLRTSVQMMPGEALYHAALGLALAKNPNWVREGIQHLEQAIQLQPTRAVFHAQVADLLLGQGLPLRARRAAESALRLDPNEPTALRVFEATNPEDPGPGEGGGGLRGLLRRRS
jgi:curved DNA-binding protein CbpA